MEQNEELKEFGKEPELYAVVFDENTPSTWRFPIFDSEDVSRTLESLTYGSYNDPVLLPVQREQAYERIKKRIEELNVEERTKESLRNRLQYCQEYNGKVSELASVANEDIRYTLVSEFSGTYPEIPAAKGVNVADLTKGDNDALFVSLPVAEIGVTSRNGLYYDEKLVSEIEKQINEKRPNANFGHIKDQDRDTVFDVPAGIWVGAIREGKKLWGKAYILPGEENTYIRKLKAVGGSVATSIYGRGSIVVDKEGRKRAASFILESLDFGSKDRVSLDINPQMVLTTEFVDNKESKKDTKKMSDKLDVTQLRKEDAAGLPQEVKDAVLKEFEAASQELDKISELTFTIEQKDKTIAEYEKEIKEYRAERFSADLKVKIAEALNWDVSTADEKAVAALEALKTNLNRAVLVRLNGDLDTKKIERYITETMQTPEFSILAETVKERLAGPAVVVAANTGKENWREELVKNSKEIAKQLGAVN